MKKMTIKAYAVKHRLSIFNVVKMLKSGELDSETVEENGKEVVYILTDEKKEEEISQKIIKAPKNNERALKEDVSRLSEEVKALRAEIEALKKSLR
jgi:polyhydroxyalkanoate synthesis regulator phasin